MTIPINSMRKPRPIINVGLVLCLISIFFWSCVTTKVYDSWKGATVSKLLSVWGLPKEKRFLRRGGTAYIYDSVPGETKINYLGNVTGPTKLTAFYINKNGIIYKWNQKSVAKTFFK